MDWVSLVVGLVGGAGIVGALASHGLWRVQSKQEEAREKRRKVREQSAAVADILAEWVRPTYLQEREPEDYWRLQTTYWKNILNMDVDLFRLLAKRLKNEPDALSTNGMIVAARQYLLGLPEPDIEAGEIVTWKPLPKDG